MDSNVQNSHVGAFSEFQKLDSPLRHYLMDLRKHPLRHYRLPHQI